MAIRRSSEQLKTDRIIKKQLLIFGDEVLADAVPQSRRDTGSLQDEMNFRVEKDTQLHFAQMWYGAINYPKGKESGKKNALKIVIDEKIGDQTRTIIKNINEVLLKDFKKK